MRFQFMQTAYTIFNKNYNPGVLHAEKRVDENGEAMGKNLRWTQCDETVEEVQLAKTWRRLSCPMCFYHITDKMGMRG